MLTPASPMESHRLHGISRNTQAIAKQPVKGRYRCCKCLGDYNRFRPYFASHNAKQKVIMIVY